MNETRKKIHILVLHLICLITVFSSCTHQNTSIKKPVNIDIKTKSSESTINTDLKLEFTSMVRSIFEDSKGNYWFGSDREGVCKYDGKSFTYFTEKDGLSNNQIRTIQEDKNGYIWFATGNGLSTYNGKEITTNTKQFAALNKYKTQEWKKGADDLWFNGELEGGIYRYDGQYLTVLEFPSLDPNHESFSISGTVTGVSQGKNNMLWIANYNGVIGYNGKSFTYINKRDIKYHVRSIFEDSKGNLWIGNNGIGVLLYDGNTTVNFTKKNGLSYKSGQTGEIISPEGTLNHIFAIAEDQNGTIWFGDRDAGIWSYDGKKLTNYTVKDGLPNMFVRTIYKDKKGDLWIGMEGGNVCKFNGKSFDKMY